MIINDAYIEDLDGKYYGTSIVVNFDETAANFDVWYVDWDGDTSPSKRELENNPDFVVEDIHYETQKCYELAEFVVQAIKEKAERESIR